MITKEEKEWICERFVPKKGFKEEEKNVFHVWQGVSKF